MESRGNTSKVKKRILFVSLFVVPFLAGMALIFMGKGIGTLPFLYPVGEEIVEGKTVKQYYKVPSFTINGFDSIPVDYSTRDSTIFLVTLFNQEVDKEWEKHMMYITKIMSRYSNVSILSLFEGNPNEFEWEEDPVPFFNRYQKWQAGWLAEQEFKEVQGSLYLQPDSITGVLPYVILDKEGHIRSQCAINDLKAARDIPQLLKILNNQYAPRKIEVSRKESH